ncbi:hypothetical protein KC325_g60 [Hortaea werneckii]|nr:hypothetical protein KC325_g60 [Hortaea werneckii]
MLLGETLPLDLKIIALGTKPYPKRAHPLRLAVANPLKMRHSYQASPGRQSRILSTSTTSTNTLLSLPATLALPLTALSLAPFAIGLMISPCHGSSYSWPGRRHSNNVSHLSGPWPSCCPQAADTPLTFGGRL